MSNSTTQNKPDNEPGEALKPERRDLGGSMTRAEEIPDRFWVSKVLDDIGTRSWGGYHMRRDDIEYVRAPLAAVAGDADDVKRRLADIQECLEWRETQQQGDLVSQLNRDIRFLLSLRAAAGSSPLPADDDPNHKHYNIPIAMSGEGAEVYQGLESQCPICKRQSSDPAPAPAQPAGEQEKPLTRAELADIEQFQRQRRKGPVPADARLYVAEIDRLLAHVRIRNTPLCAVHADLEDADQLECEIGNDCVACSLHERTELLTILEPFANPDGTQDSTTVLRNALALSSRDAEIREVLEGLSLGTECWCPVGQIIDHTPVCLATRALWNKLKE